MQVKAIVGPLLQGVTALVAASDAPHGTLPPCSHGPSMPVQSPCHSANEHDKLAHRSQAAAPLEGVRLVRHQPACTCLDRLPN